MAKRDIASFKAVKNARYQDNTTGSVTAKDSRDTMEDVADSFVNKIDDVIDEDDMASNSPTKVPTQQSVKAYVDIHSGVVGSATTRNGGNIELNMKGFQDVLFFTVDTITTNETVQFAGVDNAIQAVWVFTIESGGSIQFPSAVKSTDVRMNAVKKWTPYDLGTYKATLIKNDADWLLDNIEGPYV